MRKDRVEVSEHDVMRKLKWYVGEDEKISNKVWKIKEETVKVVYSEK